MRESVELELLHLPEPVRPKNSPELPFKETAPRTPKVMPIIEEIAAEFGYTIAEMVGHQRPAHLCRVRQYAIWRAKKETGRSYPEIGRVFGNRDHSTIIHAVRVIDALSPEERASIGKRPPPPPPAPPKLIKIVPSKAKRNTALFDHPRPCKNCGTTLRYDSTGKCVMCEKERRRRYQEKKHARMAAE